LGIRHFTDKTFVLLHSVYMGCDLLIDMTIEGC